MYCTLRVIVCCLALTIWSCRTEETAESARLPNIVLILADDLGYGELGSYGQELIETPNLDALAAGGMRFTQHYSGAPVCAPARCVLLTGKHAGHAYVRGNDEWGARGDVWNFEAMFQDSTLEGQRPIPDGEITIAEVLKTKGYQTACVGKWGLGAPGTEGLPNRQGFDFFYGYNCQRQAHTFFPLHLWHNETRVFLDNELVPPNTKLTEGSDPNQSSSYDKYWLEDYSAELMQQEALGFIQQHAEQPFFLYYATPIPHVPLQAPPRWVEYYREKLGPEEPYLGDKGYFPTQFPRATYAAMISYLDEQVGQLVDTLKALGIYDETLIVFTSDNGPTYAGGADTPFFNSGGPFGEERGRAKGFTYEGGIRVPMIASWKGHIAPGSQSDHVSAFYDFMPTFCELTGADIPADHDGISFLPALIGDGTQNTHDYLYWEFPAYNGQQAVRMGPWKGIRRDIMDGNLEIELYNLDRDPAESDNVAADHPDVVARIQEIMVEAHTPPEIDRFKMKALGDE